MKNFGFMKHLPVRIGNPTIYTRPFMGLLFANLFFWGSVNVFLPVLPIYYHSLGFDDHEIGWAIGIFSLGSILFRVLAGKAVDRYGSKPMITAGIILSTGAIASYWFASSLWQAGLARFVHGAAISGFASAALTMATLMQEDKNATEAIAIYTLFTMVGVGIAASTAGWLYQTSGFLAVLAAGLGSTLLALFCFPKSPKLKVKPNAGQALPFREVAQHPAVLIPTVSLLAVNICYSAVMTYLPLLMIRKGVTEFSLFYIAYAVSVVGSRMWVGQLCNRLTPPRLAVAVLLIMALAMFLAGMGHSWWGLAAAGMGIGAGYGLAFPTLATIITNSIQPANRGTAFGFYAMAVDSGFAVGAIGLGFVASRFGYEAVFFAAGIYTLLYTGLYIFWLSPKIKSVA